MLERSGKSSNSEHGNVEPPPGALIINADDWGRDKQNTDRILECVAHGTVTSVSAMVFMQDSERGAGIAGEHNIDAGLHLNLTSTFSANNFPIRLAEHHQRTSRYLCGNRLSQIIYNPTLVNSFKYVVACQIDEYERIYGEVPNRVDGHHHMHLCANVLLGGLLPHGIIARRNFSFEPNEKGVLNRWYRKSVDMILAKRFKLTDHFFSLLPLDDAEHVDKIFRAAAVSSVEMETHPINPDEHLFLMSDCIFQRINLGQLASFRSLFGTDLSEKCDGAQMY